MNSAAMGSLQPNLASDHGDLPVTRDHPMARGFHGLTTAMAGMDLMG